MVPESQRATDTRQEDVKDDEDVRVPGHQPSVTMET